MSSSESAGTWPAGSRPPEQNADPSHVGHSFRRSDRSYVDFMHCCIEQCSAAVAEQEFGVTLLKTLDEWNYCLWTQGWIPAPGR